MTDSNSFCSTVGKKFKRDIIFTLSYLLLEPKPKISRCPCESVAAKCWPSGLHLQSNNAPWPWPSICPQRQLDGTTSYYHKKNSSITWKFLLWCDDCLACSLWCMQKWYYVKNDPLQALPNRHTVTDILTFTEKKPWCDGKVTTDYSPCPPNPLSQGGALMDPFFCCCTEESWVKDLIGSFHLLLLYVLNFSINQFSLHLCPWIKIASDLAKVSNEGFTLEFRPFWSC